MAKGNTKALKVKVANKQNTKATADVKAVVAEEVKKITVAEEPKKITAAAEPKKITVAEEPKKIATKKVESIEVKEEKVVEEKAAKTVKTTKKTTAKKTTKKADKPEKEETKTTAKKATKKATATKKTTAKKTTAKKAPKKVNPKKRSFDENVQELTTAGVYYTYEEYAMMLLEEKDNKKIVAKIVEDAKLNEELQVVAKVVVDQVADTMDIKAKDFASIKKGIKASLKQSLSDDGEENAKLYLDMFALAEKVLMLGQRKNLNNSSDVTAILGCDAKAFMSHFFVVAHDLLASWQYNDVKFYEDFAYAVLSQYDDLYAEYQLEVQMDVADLYILHGDFGTGDASYNYLLRDNQIKDYIYYRFASVYENVDLNRAKAVAYTAMQYVDERFTYYGKLVEIMNK